MADEVKPGTQTSEFKFATAVAVAGAILAGVSVALGQLQQILPDERWLAVAGTVVGGLMTVISTLGYTKSRTILKVAELQAGGGQMLKAASEAVTATSPTVPPNP